MKSELGDKFLLASLSLFIIASLIFSYFIYDESPISLTLGLSLSEHEKSHAIAIALADPNVMGEVQHIVPWPYGTYHVNGVLPPSTFHEVGPRIDRNRTLPAVEIVSGNESEMGQNILVFIDLVENRVAYIGHTKRADASGQVPPEDYFNVSIVWTGYRDGQILSEEQKTEAIRLAREDKAVLERMHGLNYSVSGDVTVAYVGLPKYDDTRDIFIGAYPYIVFTQGTPMDQPDFQVFAVVDVDRNKVIHSGGWMRTPVIL
jgi:hypothetical protein